MEDRVVSVSQLRDVDHYCKLTNGGGVIIGTDFLRKKSMSYYLETLKEDRSIHVLVGGEWFKVYKQAN